MAWSILSSIVDGIKNAAGIGNQTQTNQQAAAAAAASRNNNTTTKPDRTESAGASALNDLIGGSSSPSTTKPTISGTLSGTVTGSTSTVLSGSNKGETFTEADITTTRPDRTESAGASAWTESAGASALNDLIGESSSPSTTKPTISGTLSGTVASASTVASALNELIGGNLGNSTPSNLNERIQALISAIRPSWRGSGSSSDSSPSSTPKPVITETATGTVTGSTSTVLSGNSKGETFTEADITPEPVEIEIPKTSESDIINTNIPEEIAKPAITETLTETVTGSTSTVLSGGSKGETFTEADITPKPVEIEIPEPPVSEIVDTNQLQIETNKIAGGSTTRTDNVANYIDIQTGEVKQAAVSEAIGAGLEAFEDFVVDTGTDIKTTGKVLFTDPTTGKGTSKPLFEQMESWDKAGVSYEEQIESFATTAGVIAVPAGITAGLGTKAGAALISKVPAAGKEIAKTGATIAGFGSFAGAGGETDVSKETSKLSAELKDISAGMLEGADSNLEKIGATAGSFVLGAAGGVVDTIGGITSAGKGILDVGKITAEKGITAGLEKLGQGFDSTAEGLAQWVEEIPENPAYSAGEFVGFGKTYQTISKVPGKITTAVGKETGLIDTRIVDAGETIVSKNPLLTSSVASGAVESGGFLRVDSAPRVVTTGTEIKTLDNIGSRIEIKTPSGKELFVGGRANPLSPTGELDLARSQKEFRDIASQEGIPFIYGTEQYGKAGTILGMLDRSPEYLSSKLTREAVNAVIPADITIRTGRVLSYDLKNPVKFGDTTTQSVKEYIPGKMTEAYNALQGNTEKIITSAELVKDTGLTPTLTPKQAAGLFRDVAESEHAWSNAEKINPQFEKKTFGGFTTTGLPITKLGSEQKFLSTLKENREANKNLLKNPFVRETDGLVDLRKGQADVVDYFARDASFRLAELVGKPEALNDITGHGSAHVENVAKLARELKYQNLDKYGKVSDKEIYFAGILHDVAKNTARDSVPGGHGEIAGSILLSGASLDARKYLKPEAVPEFEKILGDTGTESYNRFLDEFEKLTPKEKTRIAAAVTHHTSNLKGIGGQVHRITEGKLGRLISDADRLELRRYADDPETFTPKQRLMFSSPKEQRAAVRNVYGETLDMDVPEPSPVKTKAVFLQERPANKNYPYGKRQKTSFKGYVPTKSGGKATAPAFMQTPKPYRIQNENKDAGGYLTFEKAGGKGYPTGGKSSYNRFAADAKQYSTIGKALKLADLEVIPKKRKKEDNLDEFGTFRRIKTQRIDHLGIYDPLEFLGKGSMTRRETRKGKALQETVTFKKTIYEVDGNYQTRKPKGRARR